MCGRYTNTRESAELAERFAARLPAGFAERYAPRFNTAPAQEVAVVVARDGERELARMRWGLVPRWARDDKRASFKMMNAKAETLLERPAYRGLVKNSRCLVPADGFYEWRVTGKGKKQPVWFSLADESLFAFAGLWTGWADEETGEIVESCTIVTTRPNELVASIHDRMPVILPREAEATWLDPDASRDRVLGLLQPYPAALMQSLVASPLVNSVRNDGPELLRAERAA
jgi:putative SOS response-associated peptidase YedK